MTEPGEGVVYVATKDPRFVEEAALSAATMRRAAPAFPIWLYTDQTDCGLNALDVFDRVVPVETCTAYGDASCGAKIDRLNVLNDPPFDRCLQIDTDTRSRSEAIAGIFRFLDDVDIAMVECHPDSSISRGLYGRPMFNGGLVLFRRTDKTAALFAGWRDLADANFRAAEAADLSDVQAERPYLAHVAGMEDRRTLLRRDQLALAQFFSPEVNKFALTYAQLSEGWNFRGMGPERRLPEPIIIDHRNAFKFTTVQDLLTMAFRRFGAGDRTSASTIYNHVLERHGAEVGQADARSIAKGLETVENGRFAAVAAAAQRAAGAEAATPPMWLVSALRMAALHIRAGQPELAEKIGGAILQRAG